jgi:Xaa-Pro aminopeptidase
MDFKGRLQRTRVELHKNRVDALLVTHLPNIRYLCGFSGSSGALVVGERQTIFFTDGRYTEQAREEVHGARIRVLKGKSALAAATEWLREQSQVRRIGIEPSHLIVAERNTLAKSLRRGAKLVEAPPMVERLRMIKDSDEIAKIRAACHLGVELFDRVLTVLRAGVRESEVAGELEFAARKAGVDQMAFSTIIASASRSALPHGRASSAPVSVHGFVVCDFGVILAGYCSDMTRTVHVGRTMNDERAVYDAVKDAQQAALGCVKPGVTISKVDQAARKLLGNRKLDKFFTHSTGHGLGLEIHEAPRVAAGQEEQLRPGMVITIEPGVYLPGKYGVRTEDTIVVTESGYEILTPCSKDLITV